MVRPEAREPPDLTLPSSLPCLTPPQPHLALPRLTLPCLTRVIKRELLITPRRIGAGDREFPAMTFTATVTRSPMYDILVLELGVEWS